MTVRGSRPRTLVALLLATVCAAANVSGAVLLADAVPYLGFVDVVTTPAVGFLYAVAAAALVLLAPTHRLAVPVLLVISFACAAEPLSLGLAQRSGMWVVIGTADLLLVPAAAWLTVVVARGEGRSSAGLRAVVGAGGVAVVAALLDVLVHDPAEWGWCRCQPNVAALLGDEDTYAALEPWLSAARFAVVLLALAGVVVELVRRPGRVGLPEAVLGTSFTLVAVGWLATWPLVEGLGLVLMLLALLREASRRRPSRAHVADLLLEAREESNPARLEELVARALGDPEATVWWWVPDVGAYRDRHGTPAADPSDTFPPARVLRVDSQAGPIATVVAGSRDLAVDAAVLESVAEALRLSTENRRLTEELRDTLDQVRESRARLVTASDETRKRIERDLHDGAQQLLISTGVKLNLATARVQDSGDPQLAEALAEASGELGRALSELRQLASGITPTALVHGGLREAVEELALRCPVPVTVQVIGDSEAGPARGVTAYFVVAECLANVAKHANARSAVVEVRLEEPLVVTVTDDGEGGADPTAGSGLRGVMDRVEAAGGRFAVTSDRSGTRVTASLPDEARR